MNISLPDSLKAFVEQQVAQHGYGTSIRSLIRDGAASAPAEPADDAHFDALSDRIRQRRTG